MHLLSLNRFFLIFFCCSMASCTDPEIEANRIFVEATALIEKAKENVKNDLSKAIEMYLEAIKNINQISKNYPKSTLAVDIAKGALKINGETISDIRTKGRLVERISLLKTKPSQYFYELSLELDNTPWNKLSFAYLMEDNGDISSAKNIIDSIRLDKIADSNKRKYAWMILTRRGDYQQAFKLLDEIESERDDMSRESFADKVSENGTKDDIYQAILRIKSQIRQARSLQKGVENMIEKGDGNGKGANDLLNNILSLWDIKNLESMAVDSIVKACIITGKWDIARLIVENNSVGFRTLGFGMIEHGMDKEGHQFLLRERDNQIQYIEKNLSKNFSRLLGLDEKTEAARKKDTIEFLMRLKAPSWKEDIHADQLSLSYAKAGNFSESQKWLKKVSEKYNYIKTKALLLTANVYIDSGRIEEAKAILIEASNVAKKITKDKKKYQYDRTNLLSDLVEKLTYLSLLQESIMVSKVLYRPYYKFNALMTVAEKAHKHDSKKISIEAFDLALKEFDNISDGWKLDVYAHLFQFFKYKAIGIQVPDWWISLQLESVFDPPQNLKASHQ